MSSVRVGCSPCKVRMPREKTMEARCFVKHNEIPSMQLFSNLSTKTMSLAVSSPCHYILFQFYSLNVNPHNSKLPSSHHSRQTETTPLTQVAGSQNQRHKIRNDALCYPVPCPRLHPGRNYQRCSIVGGSSNYASTLYRCQRRSCKHRYWSCQSHCR